MKKVALIFVLAVFAPSLVLAWLSVRSLRDQQLVLEREQALLYQRVSDSLALAVNDFVSGQQREFGQQVEAFLATGKTDASTFDTWLVNAWPLAEIGFAVSSDAKIFSPSPSSRPAARQFLLENGRFLTNREIVTVYNTWSGKSVLGSNSGFLNATNNIGGSAGNGALQLGSGVSLQANNDARATNASSLALVFNSGAVTASGVHALEQNQLAQVTTAANGNLNHPLPPTNHLPQFNLQQSAQQVINPLAQNSSTNASDPAPTTPQIQLLQVAIAPQQSLDENREAAPQQTAHVSLLSRSANYSQSKSRNVKPEKAASEQDNGDVSKIESTDAEFREVINSASDGTLARFLQNKLNVMFWHRPPGEDRVFGAQLDLRRLTDGLKKLVVLDGSISRDICAVLLDDNAKPVASSQADFATNWKSPFVATEIGEALPHWEIAIYPLDPSKLHRSARVVQLTIAMLVAVLLGAIAVGGWLIVADLRRELRLARQKTDFVSNVSHELKTPLTSIRMFSDLLAEGRVTDEAKRRSYFGIISTEAARLTRLINNVLDFAKLERGEKKYHFQPCDLASVARDSIETYRPQLDANGFKLEVALPDAPLLVHGDSDALAQVIVNLVSNAEKYSNGAKEIRVEATRGNGIEVKVLDRGPGVPRGFETKIFKQFFRVNDSLSNGVEGSGLGLALARQIARAHGGDVTYQPREGGGSCFVLRLPDDENGRK